jgi:hypothetical protein
VKARDEDGQVLLLALGFLLFFGLVIGAMLTFATASVLGTQRLREQRSTVYAADGAIDAAIQVARSDTDVGAYGYDRCQDPLAPTTPNPILLTTTASTDDHTAVKVICTWSPDHLQPDRKVTFTAFLSGTTVPVVRAMVNFHDSSTTPVPEIVSWSYCGHDPTACP